MFRHAHDSAPSQSPAPEFDRRDFLKKLLLTGVTVSGVVVLPGCGSDEPTVRDPVVDPEAEKRDPYQALRRPSASRLLSVVTVLGETSGEGLFNTRGRIYVPKRSRDSSGTSVTSLAYGNLAAEEADNGNPNNAPQFSVEIFTDGNLKVIYGESGVSGPRRVEIGFGLSPDNPAVLGYRRDGSLDLRDFVAAAQHESHLALRLINLVDGSNPGLVLVADNAYAYGVQYSGFSSGGSPIDVTAQMVYQYDESSRIIFEDLKADATL